jgi:outer membrane protein
MKKLLLLIAVFLCFQLNAQIQKGMILIGSSSNLVGNLNQLAGGSISNNAGIQFGKIKTEYNLAGSGNYFESEISITSFNLSPTAGIFITNNIMLGASVGVFILRTKDESDSKEGFNAMSFSPYLRGYFKNTGNILPFMELRGGIISMKYLENDADNNPFIGGKIGASFFVSNNISIDLFGDYLYSKNTEELQSGLKIVEKQGLFGIGVGINVYLGGAN